MNRNRKWLRSLAALLLLMALTVGMLGCEASTDASSAPTTVTTEPTGTVETETTTGTDTTDSTQPPADDTLPSQEDSQDQEGRETEPDRGEDTQPEQTTPPATQKPSEGTEPTQATEPTKPTDPVTPTQPSAPAVTGQLKVHFIDVGQADAALVQCDGKNMLIDGGNRADSNLMYTYLKKYGVSHLDYVIGTHAHEDHIGGIAGALQYATVGTVYCPVRTYSSKAFTNFVNAVNNRGASITIPSVGTSFSLGGASVKILAVNTASDANNTSIVLRITYGSTSFLFTGDAELEVEQALINRGAPLKSTVLKVGHHGSSTSSSYQFIWNVMPAYSVISVGQGNDYGHPTKAVLSRLRDANTKLYRTDMQGDIVATSNGSTVSFKVSRNANADTFGGIGGNSTQTQPTEPAETEPVQTQPQETQPPATQPPASDGTQEHFIINKTSGMFHKENCENAGKLPEDNREDYYGYREDLKEPDYYPCPKCNP